MPSKQIHKSSTLFPGTKILIMKVTFKSDDPQEIKRLTKSLDMASFIWELVHNGWRDFKHTDYDYQPSWDKISELLNDHNIDIDDLIE